MSLTKQDIDALTNRWPGDDNCRDGRPKLLFRNTDELRRSLYLAAGLTAEGERKPERVRCWLWSYRDGAPFHMAFSDPTGRVRVGEDERLTPGYFVPDGAE